MSKQFVTMAMRATRMKTKSFCVFVFVCHTVMLRKVWVAHGQFSLSVNMCERWCFHYIIWHFHEHTLRPVFMLQTHCFGWVPRRRFIDIPMHNNKTKCNWARSSIPRRQREANVYIAFSQIRGAGHVQICCKTSSKHIFDICQCWSFAVQ